MQVSTKVKAGEETQVGGSSAHAKGRYIMQVQEGIELRINEKEDGNSYTYFLPFKSVDTAGDSADPDSVGMSFDQWVNVLYRGSEINKGGWDLLSAILIHTGMVEPGEDVPVESQQFADKLKMKMVDKLIGVNVGHKKERVTKRKDDDGNLVDLPEDEQYDVNRPFAISVFPVSGGTTSSGTSSATPPPTENW